MSDLSNISNVPNSSSSSYFSSEGSTSNGPSARSFTYASLPSNPPPPSPFPPNLLNGFSTNGYSYSPIPSTLHPNNQGSSSAMQTPFNQTQLSYNPSQHPPSVSKRRASSTASETSGRHVDKRPRMNDVRDWNSGPSGQPSRQSSGQSSGQPSSQPSGQPPGQAIIPPIPFAAPREGTRRYPFLPPVETRPPPYFDHTRWPSNTYTGKNYPQPSSHHTWRPDRRIGEDIMYEQPRREVIRVRPVPKVFHPKIKRQVWEKKKKYMKRVAKPEPSIRKYNLSPSNTAWIPRPLFDQSTLLAYVRDSERDTVRISERRPKFIDSDYNVSPGPHPPTNRPEGWRAPAERLTVGILESIFQYLYEMVKETPLPEVPIKERDPWTGRMTNERLTKGELEAYKSAMMRKMLLDYAKACPEWYDSECRAWWTEVVIIGEKDAERAMANIPGWFPQKATKHVKLILQMSFHTIFRFLRSLAHSINKTKSTDEDGLGLGIDDSPSLPSIGPHKRIPIRRLTILHSFAPENLGDFESEQMRTIMDMFEVRELCFELFAGEQVVMISSLDTVANAVRNPWSVNRAKHQFKLDVKQEAEEEIANTQESGGRRAISKRDDLGSDRGAGRKNVDVAKPTVRPDEKVEVEKDFRARYDGRNLYQSKRVRFEDGDGDAKSDPGYSAGVPERHNAIDISSTNGDSLSTTLDIAVSPSSTTYIPQPEVSRAAKRKRSPELEDPREVAEVEEAAEMEDEFGFWDDSDNDSDDTLTDIKPDPWVLAEPEFDPDTKADDRVAGYIYIMERNRYAHLPHPNLADVEPDERERREIWSELFGDNDDIKREFSLADKKWLQLADRGRLPRGWIPPLGWKINSMIGENLISVMLSSWQGSLRVLDIRGHWLNLFHELRPVAKKGVLRYLDYHVIPLSPKTVKRTTKRKKPHRSPNPPLGATKSIDNILMWDFAERPAKWVRKIERKRAKARGEVWEEPPLARKLFWNVHIPHHIWMQQKDRRHFKGKGRENPWGARSDNEVVEALGKFLLQEGEKWEVPKQADDEDWTDQRCFDEMIGFVITPSDTRRRVHNTSRYMYSMTKTSKDWVADHVIREKSKMEVEPTIWSHREEQSLNDDDTPARRKRFNEGYINIYLNIIGEDGRMEMIEALKKKYKCNKLWERCHWDLVHPDYPGVTIKVEEKGE